MSYFITSISKKPSILGEGPVWDEVNNQLAWVDILDKKIYFFDPKLNQESSLTTESKIGSFAFLSNGDIAMALEDGIWITSRDGQEVKQISTIEKDRTENRFNDGKCDAAGRFWFGSMSLNEKDPSGRLYSINQKGEVDLKLKEITISNGLCWSNDNQFFYYIDTPLLRVDRFQFDLNTGKIRERTPVIKIYKEMGYPDGMTIDAEGMLWIAHWGGWQITRWDPQRGEKIDSIELPASQITSLCFGGENMDEIYVTSARRGLTEDQLKKEPLAGHTFCIKNSGFKGLPFHRFGSK